MSSHPSCLDLTIFSSLEIAFAKSILRSIDFENEEEAYALCFLMAASFEGHLCVERKENLMPRPSFLCERSLFKEVRIEETLLEKKIIRGLDKLSSRKNASHEPLLEGIVFDGSRVYLQKNHTFETKIARNMSRILQQKPKEIFDREKFFSKLQQLHSEGVLLSEQREAVQKCLDSSFSIIVGGPGTGKTYTAAEMILLFAHSFDASKKKTFRICLSAPTGLAVEHLKKTLWKKIGLSDSIECVFSTLHSLLKIKENSPKPFKQIVFMYDLIIVDEASMIDPRLMSYLLESIEPNSRLVLMGDAHQLPAVEGGSVFAEMARKKSFNGQFFSTFLKRSVRFENEEIPLFSKAILEGNTEELLKPKEKVNFLFMEEEKRMLEKFFQEGQCFFSPPFIGREDIKKCFELLRTFRLLCPLRNAPLGVETINQKFYEQMLNRAIKGHPLTLPILILRNDVEKKISNGTLGLLFFVFRGEEEPRPGDLVYFQEGEGQIRALPLCSLPEYEYGFCLSVHKSQGSEFSKVSLLLSPGSERFGREMFYTAASRAKKELLIIGRKKTLSELLKRGSLKSSGLSEKLRDEEKNLGFLL
jgi:exodeoxyribonuclease V alpha subunit